MFDRFAPNQPKRVCVEPENVISRFPAFSMACTHLKCRFSLTLDRFRSFPNENYFE